MSACRRRWIVSRPRRVSGGSAGSVRVMAFPPSPASGAAPAPGSAAAACGVERVGVGILGCGTVGSALLDLLAERRGDIAARCGVALDPVAVAVRSPERRRPGAGAELLTGDGASVVTHPDVHVVVELIGGIDPARELLTAALAAGKPVVTANKELIATHGAELFAMARAAGVDLLFEAAVAGGIPLIRALRESLAGESVRRIMGIVNGTTNFILSRMTTDGATYADALAEAQALGYAEGDPRADVEGHDAAAKAAIMAGIVFGAEVTAADVHCEASHPEPQRHSLRPPPGPRDQAPGHRRTHRRAERRPAPSAGRQPPDGRSQGAPGHGARGPPPGIRGVTASTPCS